jgi:hypothetical protein
MKRIAALLFLLINISLAAQVSEGGLPLGYGQAPGTRDYTVIVLTPPDIDALPEEDIKTTDPAPYRIGVAIPVDIDLAREGVWTQGGLEGRYLRLAIRSDEARGLILYYRTFSIPEGGRLYIYSADRSQLIGAFTSRNNPSGGYFATEAIRGDELVMEYDAPPGSTAVPEIQIYQVHYVYRAMSEIFVGESGPCEVNVNCTEGASWQNEKRSVAKIVLKAGLGTYLCTGALVNNTRQDSTPYFLTARHCGASSSLSDYSQWIFHFNYESLWCEDPPENPPFMSITGSTLLAEAPEGTVAGSDFKLLLLSQKVPESYNPYFAGWSRSETASPSGVGIHHPKGDIKKISTYTAPLVSTLYGQTAQDPDGLYWKVKWAETDNGHGVTEGGSSGSPIFDFSGRIVGTLTGGAASCNDPLAPDYYGKFSYHWASNGSPGGAQLRPYLDPDNTGVQTMNGFGYGSLLTANFNADTTVVSTGGTINFEDRTNGEPEYWKWIFYSGNPSSYSGRQPPGIIYKDYGTYDVGLIVTNGDMADTLVRKNYIRVTPNIFPNPADEYVVMDFGRRQVDYVEMAVFNMNGQLVREYGIPSAITGIWKINIGDINAGNYILRIKTNVMENSLPLIVY